MPFVADIPFYYLQVVLLFFWYVALGTSWTIVGGYGSLFSLGHAAFVGLGAYTSALLYLRLGVSPWIGIFGGMGVAAVASVLIGYPAFRFGLRGDFFALATVAFGEVAYELVNGWSGFTGGPQGISIPFNNDAPASTSRSPPKASRRSSDPMAPARARASKPAGAGARVAGHDPLRRPGTG